ncbi:hypothetical protein B0H17DRAFT_1079256 [Mycena rosella]|uniref:Uncharacterized protein n=1 Tax=Mycena rosella TaxID=1033263 RepID=A0AAD7G8L3_MYCRO|nr:hypothetical protein B0H17DRAFT_1079256 [Mycena rosella]
MAHFMSLSLFFVFTFILALGAPLDTRTVYAPPILNPTADSVWKVGEVETVTWNATGIPAGVTGMIMLGYLTPDSEHLSVTLASGFNLTDEKVNVTVPAVVSRTNYIVVLFGDSGNISPQFTIQGLDGTSVSGTTAASSKAPSTGTPTSNKAGSSVTSSHPSVTALPSIPISTTTSPASSSITTSSVSSSSTLGSSSSSLPTSSSPTTSPTPPPSNNAGWSTNKVLAYQVLLAPAALLLLL